MGAGATHGSIKYSGSPYGLLMHDLAQLLNDEVRKTVDREYSDVPSLVNLANTIVDDRTDFEHIITFLDESPSESHRQFARDLRTAFENVLRLQLARIRSHAGGHPIGLYLALFDMYNVDGLPEVLHGILTTNYDQYIEAALAKATGGSIDFGIHVQNQPLSCDRTKLLKLHGSLDWQATWPISRGEDGATLWIPPGIQKAKDSYPFNQLWGSARELLICDVVRVIGCRLDANDWDLISLLFGTRHSGADRRPYRVEVIDAPCQALELKNAFPYLEPASILEIEDVGSRLISELHGGPTRTYQDLSPDDRDAIIKTAGDSRNWFDLWLRQKVEHLFMETGSLKTPSGAVERFLES